MRPFCCDRSDRQSKLVWRALLYSPFFLSLSLSRSVVVVVVYTYKCVCVCVPFLIKHSKCHPQGRQLIDVSVGERGRTVHSATNNCWSLLMTRAVA